jgi:hypothetical protein
MEFNNAGCYVGNSGATSMQVGANNYFNGSNYIYSTSNVATRYAQSSGQHLWFISTDPTPTAGNAISFTQAMTLDASGNLGVGSTSPVGIFEAQSSTPVITAAQSNTAVTADMLLGAWNAYSYDTSTNSKGGVGGVRVYAEALYNTGLTPSYLAFFTHGSVANNNTLLGAATERARISSDGTFRVKGAGTAGSTDAFQVSGSAPADAARITSGGDFLVGTTAQLSGANSRLVVSYATADYVANFNNSNATPYGIRLLHNTDSNGTGNEFFVCIGNATIRASIRSNGGLANYSANNVNLSDRREKTNFAPAKSYLDTICAIPVQTFNYIDQSEDDPGLTLGVVAQDVQAVAPELVMESNWGTAEEPKQRLSIYQTDLQYALMKCIQEQQAIINDLRARVAALEA